MFIFRHLPKVGYVPLEENFQSKMYSRPCECDIRVLHRETSTELLQGGRQNAILGRVKCSNRQCKAENQVENDTSIALERIRMGGVVR